MELDKVAQKLGYRDVEHLEMCIENYGSPLIEWWKVMQELASNTDIIGNVSDSFTANDVQSAYYDGLNDDSDLFSIKNYR